MRAPAKASTYNPASDGFAAKAWECLRRNKEFHRDYGLENAHSEEDAEHQYSVFRSRMETHPFYAAIWAPLVENSSVQPEDRETFWVYARSLHLWTTWPEIHPDIQGFLSSALSPHGAFPVETPNRLKIDPYHNDYSPVTAKEFLASFANELDTHRVICIPVAVWDRPHKERILGEISALLGAPLAKDTRWMKKLGRALGTAAEWRAFVLVEQWRERRGANYGFGMAANLAAWEIYGKEDFGIEPRQRIKAAEVFRKRCSKIHKYASKVEVQVHLIERAIKSVWPVFDPIQSA
jgi:hypothetical protein